MAREAELAEEGAAPVSPPAKVRVRKPAVSMNFLSGTSGGEVVSVIQNVTPFASKTGELVSRPGMLFAMGKVYANVVEIFAKVFPNGIREDDVTGELREVFPVPASDEPMGIVEANVYRSLLNSYVATLAFEVGVWAAARGVEAPYACHATGSNVLYWSDSNTPELRALTDLVSAEVLPETPSNSGLSKSDADAALRCWADALATLASVVNAEPEPSEVESSD